MATNGQQTGMRAVYLVAAEMVAQGYIVSATSRNAFGADMLATNESCSKSFSVQVKANAKPASFWLLNEKARSLKSPTHVYVFVNLAQKKGAEHEYYVVPSAVVAKGMITETASKGSVWHSFRRENATKYRDAWSVFEKD